LYSSNTAIVSATPSWTISKTVFESSSCGSCSKPVSVNSSIGDYCPHCGVRWGYENNTKSTKKSYEYNVKTNNSPKSSSQNNYSYSSNRKVTLKANLRSLPSEKSKILTIIPAFSSFKILYREGQWYYIRYIEESSSIYKKEKEYKGYIHKNLVR
jgi:hypothetical protein